MGSPRRETDGMVDQSTAPQNSSPNLDVVDKKGKGALRFGFTQ